MSNCVVTIVTISKNNLDSLHRTLESVKAQDYQNIEHIIIDGDSDDGSKDLLRSYTHSKQYTHFSEPDRGISSAFNKGLDRSSGDLIFFLNAGDVFVNDRVTSVVVESYLGHKWTFAVGSIMTSEFTGAEVIYTPPQLSSKFLKFFMFLPHQAVFCETLLHKKHRFDESIQTSMDYDIFLRMQPKIFYLPLSIAKSEPGGISSQALKRIREQSKIRMKYTTNIYEKLTASIVNILILLKYYLKVGSPFASSKNSNLIP